MLKAGRQGRLMTEVARQMDDAHPGVGAGDPVEQLRRAVLGAVVDQHQLEVVVGNGRRGPGDELLDELLLVVDGSDYAQQGRGAKGFLRHRLSG